MDEWPDQSAIANLVLYRPTQEEHRAVNTRVRGSLTLVLEEIDYRTTKSEKQSWHDNNPSAFKDNQNRLSAVSNHLKQVHTHQQNLKIKSGLSINDAHIFRCCMQFTSHTYEETRKTTKKDV